jgi:hypothetical protein
MLMPPPALVVFSWKCTRGLGGKLILKTGAGNDAISVTFARITGASTITTGAGADQFEASEAQFFGTVNLALGDDNDSA